VLAKGDDLCYEVTWCKIDHYIFERYLQTMENDLHDQTDNGEESFADLFAKSFHKEERLTPGQVVEARIIKITSDWVFLDTGRKGEGVLDRKELLDADGIITAREGDTLRTYFLGSRNGELRFTTRLGSSGGGAANARIEEAWQNGIPVEGVVEKEVKGGYEVKIGGSVRAFCPYSQMGLKKVTDPAAQIGQHLSFRITTYGEGGRNIVLSHRALLEEEARLKKEALRETLHVGNTVTGTVTSLRDFGAFIDIGGLEGLLPISEVGWGRVAEIRDVLSVGQQVTVVIKQTDWENNRFSFSLRDTLADPWDSVSQQFPEGSAHGGKVVRLTTFGAFVRLAEGIDGLLHIAKLGGGKRISHPREVLKEGEAVEVIVESIDRTAKRISLSLAAIKKAEAEQADSLDEFRRLQESAASRSMGSLGDLLKAKMERGKK
jgi:small subunit ribosomal protein S1